MNSGDKQPDSIYLGPRSFLLLQNLLRRSAGCKLLKYDSWCHTTNKQSIVSDTENREQRTEFVMNLYNWTLSCHSVPTITSQIATQINLCPSFMSIQRRGADWGPSTHGKGRSRRFSKLKSRSNPQPLLGSSNEGLAEITPQVPLSSKRCGDCRFITLHYPLLHTLQRDFLSH